MLVTNNKIQPNDVITFKLYSGEEMITRIQEEHADHYMVIKPMCLIPSPSGQMALAPGVFSIDPKDPVRLNKLSVAMQAKTVQDIANQYLQQTTGLTLAKTI